MQIIATLSKAIKECSATALSIISAFYKSSVTTTMEYHSN